jgi:hypothetical protein
MIVIFTNLDIIDKTNSADELILIRITLFFELFDTTMISILIYFANSQRKDISPEFHLKDLLL